MPGADIAPVLTLLRKAGKLALRMKAKGFSHGQKPDGTFITEVDHAVDDFLRTEITRAFPNDGWLSEETPDSTARLSKHRLWVVDPIDGTRGFLRGTGPWGVGMALVERGQPIFSAIYRPADDMMFHAQRGEGAFCNDAQLTAQALAHELIVVPAPLIAHIAAQGLHAVTRTQIPLLLRLASVASREYGGVIALGNKNDWDLAPGHLLVTETGGVMTRADGSPMVYNRNEAWQPGLVAAANPQLHHRLLDCVRSK